MSCLNFYFCSNMKHRRFNQRKLVLEQMVLTQKDQLQQVLMENSSGSELVLDPSLSLLMVLEGFGGHRLEQRCQTQVGSGSHQPVGSEAGRTRNIRAHLWSL